MEDEKIVKLRQALEKATPGKPKVPRRKNVKVQTIKGNNNIQAGNGETSRQSIEGDGNFQVAGPVENMNFFTTKGPRIEMTAPFGSLGANPAFRARIEELLKKINEHRYLRLGKSYSWAKLYGDLAKAFGLDSKNWKAIWLFDESRATEIISWLENKLNNTQQGRIEKVAKGKGYAHTRGHLFRIEKNYLEQLGWEEAYIKQQRQLVTGSISRADMTDAEFNRWVDYLRRKTENIYGESDD